MSFIKKLSKILTKFRKQILVVTLSLATASAIFGISFYFFYQENIQQYMNNNYSFKLYLTNISKNDTDTYSKLKESTYVKDVFLFNEKNAILNFPDRPAFDLIGTIPGNLNITQGRDLDYSNDYEMICPSNLADVFGKEIDTIYLTFPEPWPKKKDIRRRLTHEVYLRIYDRIFKKN